MLRAVLRALFVSCAFSHVSILGAEADSGQVHAGAVGLPGAIAPQTAKPTTVTPDACTPDLRVLVLTMARSQSLRRLMNSLQTAEYDGDCVAVDIWIDVRNGQPPDPATVAIGQQLAASWPHRGVVRTHARDSNVGLARQWHETWDLSIPGGLKEDTSEIGLILEDDLEVSPVYWRWLKAVHTKYRDDPSVGAFSLQRANLCLARCASLGGGPVGDGEVMKYQLVGSWGFSPKASHWVKFNRWYEEFQSKGLKPYVDGATTSDWYKSFELKGRCPGIKCMWTQHYVKFTTVQPQKFTIYFRAPEGKTLCANWQEDGLHYSGQGGATDFPRYVPSPLPTFTPEQFPDKPKVVMWSGKLADNLDYAGVDQPEDQGRR